jgi:hypothetical protein
VPETLVCPVVMSAATLRQLLAGTAKAQTKKAGNYRIRAYDVANDIWLLQHRIAFFFWINIAVGPKEKMLKHATDAGAL